MSLGKNRQKCGPTPLFVKTNAKLLLLKKAATKFALLLYLFMKKLPIVSNRPIHRRKFAQSGRPDAEAPSFEQE
jgi:hypothetical protein